MKTFACNFAEGISCKVECSDAPPEKGLSHIQKVEWNDPKNKKGRWIMRPYIAWMNSVQKTLSDEWGVSLLYTYMISPTQAEVWLFAPNQKPTKI